ncbi:MAG TPA: hypothetical protein DGB85_06085 [Deltaproteobacteria bacterium]|nr:hypothetical protein [Deltaproteobacteria bacterium]
MNELLSPTLFLLVALLIGLLALTIWKQDQKATALGCVALQHHLITSLVAKRNMDPFAIQ